MCRLIRDMGFLRTMLYLAGVLIVIFSPSPGIQVDMQWPAVLTTIVVPALAPLIVMVIFFDLVMSRVVEKGGGNRHLPPPLFFWFGLILALLILFRWLPHLLSLSN